MRPKVSIEGKDRNYFGYICSLNMDETLKELASQEYKEGFVTDVEQEYIPKGLNENIIRMISEKKGEPDWLLQFRLDAFRKWQMMKEPDWGHLKLPKIDYQDIIFCAEMGYDFLAASFVRCREDILEVRKILQEHNSYAKIIAKIENMQGIDNIDEILEVADGIMVARGDMGVEIPLEEVPVIQKSMIKKAVAKGKHVITATQMLESMIGNPRPTRAETADVANAIYDGTTAIMLSGETAAGKYPVEAVKTMARIAERTEKDIDYGGRMKKANQDIQTDITTAISHATCTTAADLKAAVIITVTMSGFTAGMISRFKPECPIIGCSVNPRVCRQLNLSWGVQPLLIEKEETADDLFEEATQQAKKAGLIKDGDIVVLTAGVPLGKAGTTNMLRVIEV